MKRLTLWLLKRNFPGHALIEIKSGVAITGTIDIAVVRRILSWYGPGHHLTKSAGKGSRIAKRKAQAEAQKAAIEEYYEDPQAETIGD